MGQELTLVQKAKRKFSWAALSGWGEMDTWGAGVADWALCPAGHLGQHLARGKAYCLPGGTPNLGKDAWEDKGGCWQVFKLEEKGVSVGKEYWLKGQLEKDARVSGGTTGVRHGGWWVRGLSLLQLCPIHPCGSVTREPSLTSMFTGNMTIPWATAWQRHSCSPKSRIPLAWITAAFLSAGPHPSTRRLLSSF